MVGKVFIRTSSICKDTLLSIVARPGITGLVPFWFVAVR